MDILSLLMDSFGWSKEKAEHKLRRKLNRLRRTRVGFKDRYLFEDPGKFFKKELVSKRERE